MQGQIQNFQIEGAQKMCIPYKRKPKVSYDRCPGPRLRALHVLKCFLSHILKHSYTKWDKNNKQTNKQTKIIDLHLEGVRAHCAPTWIRPWVLYTCTVEPRYKEVGYNKTLL